MAGVIGRAIKLGKGWANARQEWRVMRKKWRGDPWATKPGRGWAGTREFEIRMDRIWGMNGMVVEKGARI